MNGMRKRLLSENPYCHYCNRRVGKKSSTLDHWHPKFLGGGRGKNLKLCCKICNNTKGNMPGKKWDKLLPILIAEGYFQMDSNQRNVWRQNNRTYFQ
jgi:5-methylcytosine-specific restriction endonuclease McrA